MFSFLDLPVFIDVLNIYFIHISNIAVVSDVYSRKPSIVMKHVLPILWSLLQGSGSSATLAGGSTKDALGRLTRQLYSLMGESLVEHAETKSQRIAQKLKDIIDT